MTFYECIFLLGKKKVKNQVLYVMIVSLYGMIQLKPWVFLTHCSNATDHLKERTNFSGYQEDPAVILEKGMFLIMFSGLVNKSLTLPLPIF